MSCSDKFCSFAVLIRRLSKNLLICLGVYCDSLLEQFTGSLQVNGRLKAKTTDCFSTFQIMNTCLHQEWKQSAERRRIMKKRKACTALMAALTVFSSGGLPVLARAYTNYSPEENAWTAETSLDSEQILNTMIPTEVPSADPDPETV